MKYQSAKELHNGKEPTAKSNGPALQDEDAELNSVEFAKYLKRLKEVASTEINIPKKPS